VQYLRLLELVINGGIEMVTKIEKVSETLSLKGYDIKTWLKENKDSIKTTVATIGGLLVASRPISIWIQILFGGSTGLITKWALDALDFWVSRVEL